MGQKHVSFIHLLSIRLNTKLQYTRSCSFGMKVLPILKEKINKFQPLMCVSVNTTVLVI